MAVITNDRLLELARAVGYTFKDWSLLRQALTHSSFSHEQKMNRMPDYERLEFLGDSVLEMVSSTFLFKEYPDKREGELSKTRASMVCEAALAYCAADLSLKDYILLGRGEEMTGGRNRDSIISDVMEAVIGAIYLDGGIEPASAFIHRFILSDLENKVVFYDAKSILQEMVQSKGKSNMRYELIGESGPEHDKTFHAAVYIGDEKKGEGQGHTKKAAEQKAAYEAIQALRNQACI